MDIAAGDIVQVNQRGRVFFARVQAVAPDGSFGVAPLDRTVRVRRATLDEVTGHWVHSTSPSEQRDRDQLDLNEWIDD